MNLADASRSALRAGIGGCLVALLTLAASITPQDRAWAQQSSAAQDVVPRGAAAADLEQLLATIEDDQRRAELARDETYRPLIVEPLGVVGIDAFQASAVVIKARITTKPNRHLDVGREFNRRMKRRFDEFGIEIPFPHRTIYVRNESPVTGPTPQSAG